MSYRFVSIFLIISHFSCTGRNRKDLHTPLPDASSNTTEEPKNSTDTAQEDDTAFPSPQTLEQACLQDKRIWRWEKCLSIEEAIATECATTARGEFIATTPQRPAYCKHPEPTNEERCISSGYQYQWKDETCQPKDFTAWCLDTSSPPGVATSVEALLWSIGQNPQKRDCSAAASAIQQKSSFDLSLTRLSEISKNPNFPPLIDLEPLRILSQHVQRLNLQGHKLKDIEVFENWKSLVELNLSYNDIEEFSSLQKITSLKKLDLQHNKISSLEGITLLEILEEVNLSHNQVTDLTPFIHPKHGWPKLTTLQLHNNSIQNPEPLEAISRLTHLYLSHNSIHNLKFLNVLLHLQTVDLKENPLTPENLAEIEEIKKNRTIEIIH